MTQNDPYSYGVDRGEKVTVVITPKDGAVGERVTAAVDGEILQNEGDGAQPVFSFTVSKASGERHFLVATYFFVAGDPDRANYEVRVNGSKGGDFPSNTVWKEDGLSQDQEYRFRVN